MLVNKINYTNTPRYLLHKAPVNAPDNKTNTGNQINQMPRFAYMDFNINFGARLFRSPENFYEQPFNQKNMPDSMKKFLMADYENRKSMPPALVMKIVFEDINSLDSLNAVKKHYDEPLFKDLTDEPKRNARKGIVSEVEAMKSEMDYAPLFKDGNSNFGLYLLRKIYFEGKTLNEINKDFKKDLSKTYDGLITSDINYEDLSAYGIKFPKTPFWKSFIATREDFPYVYKPRKSAVNSGEHRERTLSDIMSGNYTPAPKARKQRFKIKDNGEAKRMGDALINGHGDVNSTEKALRSKGIRDAEELSFVSRYLGQIMSIALEKTHASDEMRSFFENYDSMNKKQKEKMDAYWKNNPQMRELQSLAISDTIKLFFEVYEDGTNTEEFQELLNYADSIKPQREARLKEHELLQAVYDELFSKIDNEIVSAPDPTPVQEIVSVSETPELSPDELLEELAKQQGAEIFTYKDVKGNTCKLIYNPDEMWRKHYQEQYSLMPQAFVNKCIMFLQNSKLANDDYYRIMALSPSVPSAELERIMPSEKYNSISARIGEEFSKKNFRASIAAQQAASEALISRFGEKYIELMGMTAYDMCDFAKARFSLDKWSPEEEKIINQKYSDYIQPLNDKHTVNQLAKTVVDCLAKFGDVPDTYYTSDGMDKLVGANLRENPVLKNQLARALKQSGILQNYGSSAKFILRDDISEALRMYKARLIIEHYMEHFSDDYVPYLIDNYDNIDKYIAEPDYKIALYNQYLQRRR